MNKKNNFKYVISSLPDVKIIFIDNKNQIINYFNTSNINGTGTRINKIVELTWFGHGYPYLEYDDLETEQKEDQSIIFDSHPFLAFGINFLHDVNDRFLLSDIDRLDKTSFKLDYAIAPEGYKAQFYTCNTGTGDKDSFGYHFYNHLNSSVKSCVYKTDYDTITYKYSPTIEKLHLEDRLRVKKLREPYGFCIQGSDRYPIPGSNGAHWVYWR